MAELTGIIALADLRFKRSHEYRYNGAYRAFSGADWLGDVQPCNASMHLRPFCGGCGGWHGFTHTTKGNGRGLISMNLSGFATRADAARALAGVRLAWSQVKG